MLLLRAMLKSHGGTPGVGAGHPMLSRNLSPPRLSLVAVAVPYGWVKV